MSKTVSREEIQAARRVDLLTYMESEHPDLICKAGVNRCSLKAHDSCIITAGKGYSWNSKNETGNGIDFLTRYLGYNFVDAVEALCKFGNIISPADNTETSMQLPAPQTGSQKRLWAYLLGRGLNNDTIREIVLSGSYETIEHHNIAFVSNRCTFTELCGTLSKKRFKGVLSGSDPDGYWTIGSGTKKIYVTESAIDAASLYQLAKNKDDITCVSMAGLKIGTLHRISRDYQNSKIILAVDNDNAGNEFCEPLKQHFKRIIPQGAKDWNEQLQLTLQP